MSDTRPPNPRSQWALWFPTFTKLRSRLSDPALWIQSSPSVTKVIQSSPLPISLKVATERFVGQSKWRGKSARNLAQTMLNYFAGQLEHGASAETLAAQWDAAVPLPAFRRLKEPSLLVIHSLPTAVTDLIGHVIRKTKLWRSERIDVARELIAHFQDGLDAGLIPEQLILNFGDRTSTAQLIRRAKLRNRPFMWQIFRRTSQVIAIALVVLIVWWIWLLVRFQFSKPNVVHDYIGELDARSISLPETDRAWPFYAEAQSKMNGNVLSPSNEFTPPKQADGTLAPEWVGLTKPVDVVRVDGRVVQKWRVSDEGVGAPSTVENVQREYEINLAEFSKGLDELSRSPHWPALVQYAQMNEQAIGLILKGSTRPTFGFIFRDPANAEWLARINQGAFVQFEKRTHSLLMGVLIPQIQQMRSLEHLLRIETERARVAGDRERVVEILSAYLKIAAQIYHADGFAVTKVVSLVFASLNWNVIRQILNEQPDFFAEDELRILAHNIAAYRSTVDLDLRNNSKVFVDDLLQRLYTDDGREDGHLTADGLRLLQEPIQGGGRDNYSWPGQFQLEGSFLSGVVVSRAELKRIYDRYCELESKEENVPLREARFEGPSPALEFLMQTVSTSTGRIRYSPVQFLEPLFSPTAAGTKCHIAGECAKMRCDSTLVALALELYHRRHNAWPTRLDELCPDLLPVVPLDRFDGKPMKYRVIEGKPAVYSVGRNQVDDGGQWTSESIPGFDCREGDWRLWPIRTGDR